MNTPVTSTRSIANFKRLMLISVAVAAVLTSSSCVFAARLLYRDAARAQGRHEIEDGEAGDGLAKNLPPDIRIARDVAYGGDPKQRFDVYMPAHAQNAPVIFMVHGGGWMRGDKTMSRVVENKVRHWLPQGYVFISVNNRLLPQAAVEEQAQDVAQALAYAQAHAAQWGADASNFILMGHSAGAHLIALVGSSPTLAARAGAKAWRGSVILDSAAYDIATIMRGPHFSLYDRAFGGDPAQWSALSPLNVLMHSTPPVLAVCSSRRADSCAQAQAYVDKARALGTRARLLPQNLSHGDINAVLGTPGAYTEAVDGFLHSLGGVPTN